jgi:hypothetical protein
VELLPIDGEPIDDLVIGGAQGGDVHPGADREPAQRQTPQLGVPLGLEGVGAQQLAIPFRVPPEQPVAGAAGPGLAEAARPGQ